MEGDEALFLRRNRTQNKIIDVAVGRFRPVELTGHAVSQMKMRGLTEGDVLAALREPDQTGLPVNADDRKRVRRNKTARTAVDVIYMELGNRLLVITAIRIDRRMARRKRK